MATWAGSSGQTLGTGWGQVCPGLPAFGHRQVGSDVAGCLVHKDSGLEMGCSAC